MYRANSGRSSGLTWLGALWIEGRRPYLGLLVAALCALLSVSAWSQEAPMRLTNGGERVVGHRLQVKVGGYEALSTSWNISRVSIADPSIADANALESNEVLIVGNSVGVTDLILWGENGEVWSASIEVDIDIDALNKDLDELFPRTGVKIIRSQDVYIVKGTLERLEHAQQLNDFLAALSFEYVDMTRVAGLQQVQIKVRVAEVNRVAIKRLGVNMVKAGTSFFGSAMVGSAGGGALNSITMGPAAGALASGSNVPFLFGGGTSPFNTLTLGFPKSDLEFFIQALAENQYLRILAEPTLVALSGHEASFLAGGEFPIPVVQGGGGAGGGTSISIEYKEFGIRLKFTPTVLGNGIIRLHVAPEVSELSDIGAVVIQGFNIPSVLTRRAETTVELRSGQTFSMAGLLSQSSSARNSRIPLLGDLPVLGSLFRSVSYRLGESELVVLVTATLVEPLSHASDRPLPGDLHTPPNDWELFGMGRLEGHMEHLSKVSDASVDMGELADLKGPGAWASYYEDEESK